MTHAGFCSLSVRPTHAMGMRKDAATTRVDARESRGRASSSLSALSTSHEARANCMVLEMRPMGGVYAGEAGPLATGSPPVGCGPGMIDPFAPDPSFQPLRHRAPRWPFVLVGVFLLIGAAVLALWPVKVPYFAIAPGPGGGGGRPHLGG